MWREIRHGLRVLAQTPGWTAVVIVSLALGVGANTALFGAVNGLLLKKIPVRDPDSLVRLRYTGRGQMVTSSSSYGFSAKASDGRDVRATFSYHMYQRLVASNHTLTDLVACAPFGRVNVMIDGAAEIATAFITSGNYYRALGISPAIGRTIVPDDDTPGADAVAVISYTFWQSRFGGRPNAVGSLVRVNDVNVTVVGVLPPEYTGIQQAVGTAPDVSLPLAVEPRFDTRDPRLNQPTWWWLEIVGRLKPGATSSQVEASFSAMFRDAARAGVASLSPAARSRVSLQNRTEVPALIVDSAGHGVYDPSPTDLRAVNVLAAVVVLVLLIVCANVANLLLSRATARRRELSVRLALGATRTRVMRQLLVESLLLASAGGAIGAAIGYWGQRLLPGRAGQPISFDWRMLAFVAAATVVTAIVFGIAPTFRVTRVDVSAELKATNRSVAGNKSRLSRALLVAQVAISLVLLIGAGLFLRTLGNLRSVDVGFNPNNLLLFRLTPSLNGYDAVRQDALFAQVGERLRSVPGVRAVAWSNPSLLSGSQATLDVVVQGEADRRGHEMYRVVISPSFFDTTEMPLVAGRAFTDRDSHGQPPVAIINQAAARAYFPDGLPIGRRFGPGADESGKMEIIGVVKDAKYDALREAAPPTMYVPYRQTPQPGAVFEVRTAGEPLASVTAVRQVVRQIDPAIPLTEISTQLDQIGDRMLQERLFAQAYTLFGALATLVASIGIFGLMSYSVARRTNEIGVRMALGAQRRDVLALVMGESMPLVGVGLAIGLSAAVAAGRLIASLLFGVAPTDVATMAAAAALLVAVSALAGYLPARTASRLDPMIALRDE